MTALELITVCAAVVVWLLWMILRELVKLRASIDHLLEGEHNLNIPEYLEAICGKLNGISEETRKAREELTEQRRERRLKEMDLPVRGYQK